MSVSFNGQTKRILEFLIQNDNREVSSLDLHRVGSGKEFGWCGSLSRRISDIREMDYDVRLTRIKMVNGQRRTYYMLIGAELTRVGALR